MTNFSTPSPFLSRRYSFDISKSFFFFFILGIFILHGYNPIFNFRCVSKLWNNYSKIGRNFFFFFLLRIASTNKSVSRFNQNFVVPALAISYLALNIHKLKFVTRRKEGFYVSPLCRGVTPKIEIQ